jgi:2-oxoglutarate/2-oxoacid ferredoxin oxidoreductase subunit alpha
MPERLFLKENEALAEAAIRAGCRFFAGYPITPQTEIIEYMSWRMPEVGGVFIMPESEIAAINMVYGAAGAGARAMTATSGPGMSLKQEGISSLAACELPCVIVNMSRGGPGTGNLGPSQADYFQATRGGGHGGYRVIVLGPSTVQETVDLTMEAFYLADKYRIPVVLLADAILAKSMEPVHFPDPDRRSLPEKNWTTTGARGRDPNVIVSMLYEYELEQRVTRLQEKYRQIEQNEVRVETQFTKDCDLALIAFGTTARICRTVVRKCRAEGLRVGLVRPITLWPFPMATVREAADSCRELLVVEMNTGQMIEDVRLAAAERAEIHFYGRTAGSYPDVPEIAARVRGILAGGKEGK